MSITEKSLITIIEDSQKLGDSRKPKYAYIDEVIEVLKTTELFLKNKKMTKKEKELFGEFLDLMTEIYLKNMRKRKDKLSEKALEELLYLINVLHLIAGYVPLDKKGNVLPKEEYLEFKESYFNP